MSIASAAIAPLEKRLPKVIDARTHGIIDYCHAAFFLGMALVCRKKNPRAAAAALTTGAFVLVESLLTDYPLGVKKVIPFELHGKLDSAFAATSMLLPKFYGFADTPEARVFSINSAVEGTLVSMTKWDSGTASEEDGQIPLAEAS